MVLGKLLDRMIVQPSEVLMVGDSQKKDVEGAVRVGMRGLLYKKSNAGNMDKICMRYIDHDQ
jgi:putative hydrolase of the HAD superfamily